MTSALAIDPGPTRSAWLLLVDGQPGGFAIEDNEALLDRLRRLTPVMPKDPASTIVIERIEAMGMSVGAETFETVYWSGRFAEATDMLGYRVDRVTRRAVKLHLCGTPRAKDPNVRQALIDRFGGDSVARGSKAAPGPLYGIANDVWAALAVGVTWFDAQPFTSTRMEVRP